jgi:hypothetical protein
MSFTTARCASAPGGWIDRRNGCWPGWARQAASLPPIERSLKAARPEWVALSPVEAHRFLRESGPLLESNGFGVLLPSWWNARQRTRLGMRLRLLPPKMTRWNEDDDARIAVVDLPGLRSRGGERVRLCLGIDARRRTHQPGRVRPTGRAQHAALSAQRQVDRTRSRPGGAAKRFLADRHPTGAMSLLQSIRMAQAYLERNDDAAPFDIARADHSADLTVAAMQPPACRHGARPRAAAGSGGCGRLAARGARPSAQPESGGGVGRTGGFVGELRPYQRRGVGWLVYLRRLGLGACLADDMGLGKTVQAIAMLLHAAHALRKAPARLPALLICPTSVVANWRREVERFAPDLRTLVHHGGSRMEGRSFVDAVRHYDLVITSYGTARRDMDIACSSAGGAT